MASGSLNKRLFSFLKEVRQIGIRKGKMINYPGRNQQTYHYRSIVDIMPVISELFDKHDLSIMQTDVEPVFYEGDKPKKDFKGNDIYLATGIVKCKYIIYDIDGNESREHVYLGGGDGKDAAHKGFSAAQTNALKAFVLTSLACLPNGDNDEEDHTPQIQEEIPNPPKNITKQDIDDLNAIKMGFKYESSKQCRSYEDAKKLWIDKYYPQTTHLDKPDDWNQSIQTILSKFPKKEERIA